MAPALALTLTLANERGCSAKELLDGIDKLVGHSDADTGVLLAVLDEGLHDEDLADRRTAELGFGVGLAGRVPLLVARILNMAKSIASSWQSS